MEVKLTINKRNRDFGIITWPYSLDFEIKTLFEQKDIIEFKFDGKILKRKISYKYRRFSFGKNRFQKVAEKKHCLLSKNNQNIDIQLV